MIFPNLKAEVPDVGGYIMVRNGIRYMFVYVGERIKHKDGTTTHPKSRMIGRVARDADGKDYLIPNENYFRLMNKPLPEVAVAEGAGRKASRTRKESLKEKKTYSEVSLGYDAVIQSISAESGLTTALDKAFGRIQASKILTTAAFLCERRHSSFADLGKFVKEHLPLIGDNSDFDRRAAGQLLVDLTTADIGKFYTAWNQIQATKGCHVFYDVTSFSTYSGNILSSHFGYNRDGEELPQINQGLFCLKENGLPLYMCSYDGSLNDAQNFNFALTQAKAHGLGSRSRMVVITDGGFNADNFYWSHLSGYKVIAGVSCSKLKAVREAYLKWVDSLTARDENNAWILDSGKCYLSSRVPITLGDVEGTLIMYRDIELQKEKTIQLTRKRKDMLNYLNSLEKIPVSVHDLAGWAKSFRPFFKVTINRKLKKGFSFEPDEQESINAFELCGKVTLFTTCSELSDEEIIKLYRSKESVEDCFDTTKNGLSDKRLHVHGDRQVEGKLFIMFIALILWRILQYRLSDWKKAHDLTMREIIQELNQIKIRKLPEGWQVKNATSKTQREILEALDFRADAEDQILSGGLKPRKRTGIRSRTTH